VRMSRDSRRTLVQSILDGGESGDDTLKQESVTKKQRGCVWLTAGLVMLSSLSWLDERQLTR
jgi:hypothetical protein